MAHAALLRTNTAPVFQASTDVARLNNMSLSNAARASQLSGSTAFNSSTSLSSLTSSATAVTPVNGQVVATTNIINQRADASRSLYQICLSLKQRLAQVPGFEGYLEQLQREQENGHDGPVEALWKLLRTGLPLLTIYNALQPEKPLHVDQRPNETEARRSKRAIMEFVKACLSDLDPPVTECFIVADLTGEDTTGFVKVTSVINYVLDLAEKRGLLLQTLPYPEDDITQPGSKMTHRDYIVRELVDTERKYVQDLENLHDLKRTLEHRSVIPGEFIHDIFLNINAILDHQRKFLIRVETTNSMPQARQEWGSLFVTAEENFGIYQPFIANQRKAAQVATQVFDKIQEAGHPVACDFNTLDGFLLKPMQRLVKYPLLLKDLLKKSEDEHTKEDLAAGIAAAERVLMKANSAVDKNILEEALQDLIHRVDDWKSHKVDNFGSLLLHGVYTVITGKSEQEKDYEIYLFENILLCCKELTTAKTKDKKDKTRSSVPKVRNKFAKLQLKGRIFMTNVTDVVAISKPGSYTVQIWWKGDPGVENFMIKFQTEEMMKKWAAGLEEQRKQNTQAAPVAPDQAPPNFAWLASQGNGLENPYRDEEEDEDIYNAAAPTVAMPGTMPRNGSSTSLRQRSATSDSLAGMARAPPPRFPLPQAPAPLNVGLQPSPAVRAGESYFSPVAESPASSRTSTASGIFAGAGSGYPFPKTSTPQGWQEDSNRYTAPAMPRAPSRDGPSPGTGRNPRGPSMPVMPRGDNSQFQQARSRSYSTPDIAGQAAARINQTGVPAVPGIPAHLTHARHDSNIPRSNTGSPANDLPLRTQTGSPGRERNNYGGQLNQFPPQPIRQGTPGSVTGFPPPSGPPPPGMAPLAPTEGTRNITPSLGTAPIMSGQNPLSPTDDDMLPTQLKVKVHCDTGNYITLVVLYDITYEKLIDRIDNKLSRFTTSSIGGGNLRLRYRDEDGDFVMIESDDDIQIAISDWREGLRNPDSAGEIDLYCEGELLE
ncbi:rho guanyl nucleotide exchange factor [Neurospora intermedia]|uniref:Rho guanyl nucleotide exchange factor n=1 Tax=Neurospora intermedia TaxID=5142 RepID=A0ABR3D6D3_NEUIN